MLQGINVDVGPLQLIEEFKESYHPYLLAMPPIRQLTPLEKSAFPISSFPISRFLISHSSF